VTASMAWQKSDADAVRRSNHDAVARGAEGVCGVHTLRVGKALYAIEAAASNNYDLHLILHSISHLTVPLTGKWRFRYPLMKASRSALT